MQEVSAKEGHLLQKTHLLLEVSVFFGHLQHFTFRKSGAIDAAIYATRRRWPGMVAGGAWMCGGLWTFARAVGGLGESAELGG